VGHMLSDLNDDRTLANISDHNLRIGYLPPKMAQCVLLGGAYRYAIRSITMFFIDFISTKDRTAMNSKDWGKRRRGAANAAASRCDVGAKLRPGYGTYPVFAAGSDAYWRSAGVVRVARK
jgi:hypothetical protein